MRAALRQIPILSNLNLGCLEFEHVAGRQLLNRQKRSQRVRNVTEIQILQNRFVIYRREFRSHGKNRLDLRPEQQPVARQRVVQRLFSEAIASQQQLAAALVIQRESKHSAELFDTVRAELLIEMNDHFGVAVRSEAMTAFFQFDAQLGKVVDLAIEDNPDSFVFIEYRLMPARQVDDAEASHPHSHASFYKDAFIIGPAMHNGFTHPVNGRVVDAAIRVSLMAMRPDNPSYTPHALSFQNHFRCPRRPGIVHPWARQLELVVPVISRVPFPSVTRRQYYIHHLARGKEMQNV